MEGQDWDVVKITGSSEKKKGSVLKQKVSASTTQASKLDTATEAGRLKYLAPESKQELIAKRVALKKSQVELNQLCNFPPNTIRDIEAGKVAPTIGQLNTLNRILKAGLKLV